MTEITRRRMDDDFESWGIMLDDIRVGTISMRVSRSVSRRGNGSAGFIPGSSPASYGVARTFEEARVEFQAAWDQLSASLPATAFEEYREWQAAQQIRDRRIRDGWVPPEWDHGMTCPCGVNFDSWNPTEMQEHVPHITAAKAAKTRQTD